MRRLGANAGVADTLTKTGPTVAVVGSTLAVWYFDLVAQGVSVVGKVPQSLLPFTLQSFSMKVTQALLLPAINLRHLVCGVDSSRANTGCKKRQLIDPDQELFGLGAANIGAAFTGGFPVTGGFSRSVVNFDAGAQTPAAGAFTAALLAVAAISLTPLVYYLPNATLAATIIVAV